MALRCRLVGHKWENVWDIIDTDIETQPKYESGSVVAEEVYKKEYKERKCNRCGKVDQDTERYLRKERLPHYGISKSLLPPEKIKPDTSLNSTESEDFFKTLKEVVEEERSAQKSNKRESYHNLGFERAKKREEAVGPFEPILGTEDMWLRLMEEGEDGRNKSNLDLMNDKGIHPKNVLLVDTEKEKNGFPVEVEVVEVKRESLSVKECGSTDNDIIQEYVNETCSDLYLYPILNPIPFERKRKALKQVERSERKSELLTGNRSLSFTKKYPAPDPEIKLNKYQEQALIWADCADDLALIHGPPGTGKTRTLTAYVQHAVQKGQRVLVTAHSNAAVDNLLVGDSTTEKPEEGTLHQLAQAEDSDLAIKRVGGNSSNKVVLDQYYTNHDQGENKRKNVVAATTSGASEFDEDKFDVAVVDEATQADKASTSIVLHCTQKLVLAGDHKQLPPYSAIENEDNHETVISLFEYLLDRYGRDLPILLRKQYRMNDVIAQFPNKAFYDNKLETAKQSRDWQIGNLPPLSGVHTTGGEQQSAGTHSYQNQNEAEIVAKEVESLINEFNISPEDIGVISGYSVQIKTIKKSLKKLSGVSASDVTVDTVDSFQGGEREVIIVSFVRSNSGNNSGFLEEVGVGERRLNVALTRARKRLVLIGDWDTLGKIANHRKAETSCAPVYAELEDYIRSLGTMSSVPDPSDK